MLLFQSAEILQLTCSRMCRSSNLLVEEQKYQTAFRQQTKMECLDELEEFEFLEKIETRRQKITSVRVNDFETLDEKDFHARYRLTKDTFAELLKLIQHQLPSSNKNNAHSPQEQLLIALWFYATGTFQLVIGDTIGTSQPSCSRIINRVSRCIAALAPTFITLPIEPEELKEVSDNFYQIAAFPGVIGTLDCSQIPISSPGEAQAERFRCRKGFFSINVQTVIDSDLIIKNVVSRWPGSTHDSTIFDHCSVKQTFLAGKIPPCYHLLGDSGYACEPYLLTPVTNPNSGPEQRYNESHILTRNTVERKYGVLKRRFPCLSLGLRSKLENIPPIITAVCVLHNIAVSLGDPEPPSDEIPVQTVTSEIRNRSSKQKRQAGFIKRNLIIQKYFT